MSTDMLHPVFTHLIALVFGAAIGAAAVIAIAAVSSGGPRK